MATDVFEKSIPEACNVPLVERNPVPACETVTVSIVVVPVDKIHQATSSNVPVER